VRFDALVLGGVVVEDLSEGPQGGATGPPESPGPFSRSRCVPPHAQNLSARQTPNPMPRGGFTGDATRATGLTLH